MGIVRLRTLVVVCVLAGTLVAPGLAQAAGLLKNGGSGLCMSSYGTQTNGAPAYQYSCGQVNNQTWTAAPIFSAQDITNWGDGKCLNNRGGSNTDGNIETMWTCDNSLGLDQVDFKQSYWFIVDRYHTSYWMIETLTPSQTPSGYCLSSYGDHSVGSYIYTYTCNDSLNQAWQWQ
jgi:hypothetical protein